MHVIFVEDEQLVREMLDDDLSDAGLSVVSVSDAESCVEIVDREAALPAVLVTDINLGPGMNGLQLAAIAQQRWPTLPVIVMSGDEQSLQRLSPEMRERSLLKPFGPPRLVEAVSALMKLSGL